MPRYAAPPPAARRRQPRVPLRVSPESLRLVAVTDEPGPDTDEWVGRIAAAVRGGATLVQVRAKLAPPRDLLDLARRLVTTLPVPVLVNDRADIAIMAGAAGVHVGAQDLPVAAIREFAPANFVVGASLGSRDELASARGADYVGIGPAFASRTKGDAGDALTLDEIAELERLSGTPAIAIGGITASNVRSLLDSCPRLAGVAAVSSLFGDDDVESAAKALRAAIGR